MFLHYFWRQIWVQWHKLSGKTPIYVFSTFGSKINEFERKKSEKNEIYWCQIYSFIYTFIVLGDYRDLPQLWPLYYRRTSLWSWYKHTDPLKFQIQAEIPKWTIFRIFVAFLEYMNFSKIESFAISSPPPFPLLQIICQFAT